MKKTKKIQYYKFIRPEGNNGLVYKLGKNTDPNAIPLKNVKSCSVGAIYFTTADHLHNFTSYGEIIAFVTPIGPIKADSNKDKWKAHGINITKMIKRTDVAILKYPALSEFFVGNVSNYTVKELRKFGMKVTTILERAFDNGRSTYVMANLTELGAKTVAKYMNQMGHAVPRKTSNATLIELMNAGYVPGYYERKQVFKSLMKNKANMVKLLLANDYKLLKSLL